MKLQVCTLFLFITIILGKMNQEHTNKDIQCDKSLYSKQDIKLMINYVADSIGIYKIINDTVQSQAISIRSKYMERVQTFRSWFENRPEHLKGILNDIAENHKYAEKTILEMRKSLKEYPKLVEIYEEKVEKANKTLKKLIRHKQLCELNCAPQKVAFRAAQPSMSDHYCGSIAEVHKTIKERLENFVNDYSLHMSQELVKADHQYEKEVENSFKELKDEALKEFGRTMYDILNLQDEYHHYIKYLRGLNVDYWLMVLKWLNIELDSLLMKLDNAVDIFGAYCKTCEINYIKAVPIEDRQQLVGDVQESIIDSLINHKIAEIHNNTEIELTNMFKELNEILTNSNFDNLFISNLKPIEQTIKDLTNKEIEAFNKLKNSYFNIDPELVKKLIANTSELANTLLREVRALKAIIKDLVP